MEFVNHGHVHFYDIDDATKLCFATFEPNWNWKDDVRPLPQFRETESCQMEHIGYCLEGSMTIVMDDGKVINVKKGDVFRIMPGHNASTDVLTRMIDFHANWGYGQ